MNCIENICYRYIDDKQNEAFDLPSEFCQERLLIKTFNKWFIMSVIFQYILIGSYIQDWVIIIIIRKGRQCKAERERLTPYQSEDPNPITPTHRMKEVGKYNYQ